VFGEGDAIYTRSLSCGPWHWNTMTVDSRDYKLMRLFRYLDSICRNGGLSCVMRRRRLMRNAEVGRAFVLVPALEL
jgi:hypothetical protein